MSPNLDALLNPAPVEGTSRHLSVTEETRPDATNSTTTTYEAADALASLAGSASSAPYNQGSVPQHSSANGHAHRPGSNGSSGSPVKPSPTQEIQAPLPMVEQYDLNSQEGQRESPMEGARGQTLAPDHAVASPTSIPATATLDQGFSPLGRDASHIIPTSTQSGAADAHEQREPGYIRNEPVPTQIRQPSPPGSLMDAAAMKIKAEPDSVNAEVETLKTVSNLQNEHGLRGSQRDSSVPSIPDTKPIPAPSKKRAAPKSASKKGPGRKPASKKRKLDGDASSVNGGDLSRSTTPSRAMKNAALKGTKKSQSGTPAARSPASHSNLASSDVEGSDSEEDNELYCICKQKDDHTWMIGCEGCDDWFHGRCMNLNKDTHESLLAKFMCPNCEAEGKGYTTWRPMCRRAGCKRPAVQHTKSEIIDGQRRDVVIRSKYCSDQCGEDFFTNIVGAVSRLNASKKKRAAAATKRKIVTTDHVDPTDYSDDDYEPPPRGGVLRARDLKSLVTSTPTITDFHRLGSGVLSPPDSTASPSTATFTVDPASHTTAPGPVYPVTASEAARLASIAVAQTKCNKVRAQLADRETFVAMVRDRAYAYADAEGIKNKNHVCGWDTRLQWNEAEFDLWRTQPYGRACLATRSWDPSGDDLAKARAELDAAAGGDGDSAMRDADAPEEVLGAEYTAAMDDSAWCHRKQCPQHRAWQKLHSHEVKFEEIQALQELKVLEDEEREIKERAMVRWRREEVGEGLDKESGPAEKAGREGWVEVAG